MKSCIAKSDWKSQFFGSTYGTLIESVMILKTDIPRSLRMNQFKKMSFLKDSMTASRYPSYYYAVHCIPNMVLPLTNQRVKAAR